MIPQIPLEFFCLDSISLNEPNLNPPCFENSKPKSTCTLNILKSELLDLNLICLDDKESFKIQLLDQPIDPEIIEQDELETFEKPKGKILEDKFSPKKLSPKSDQFKPLEKTKKILKNDNPNFHILPLPVKIEPALALELGETILEKITPVYQALENLIIHQEENTHLSSIQTLTIVNPESRFNGLEIRLEFFDTHPKSISIEIMTNSTMSQYLAAEMKNLEKMLKARFQTIEFPKIALSLMPIFPTGLYQQKSRNKVSEKKAAEGKIIFKAAKAKL